MKCRSIILVACMLIVPSLAMFSHKIPAEVRASMRRGLRDSLAGWIGQPGDAAPPAPLEPPPEFWPARAAEPQSSATALTTAAPATGGLAPVSDRTAASVAAPPLVAQLADRSRQARDQHSIESRLKDLGAVSFDCQPLADSAGLYSCSCRVPIDTTGQLQRVFQATGSDPVTAADALLQQVTAWRQRAAAQPAATVAAGPVKQSSTVRFR